MGAMTTLGWVLLTLLKAHLDASYFVGYDASTPLNVQMLGEEERDGYRRLYFTYEGMPGRAVPTLLALPAEGAGPFPAVVFLHGIGQKKDFLDEIAAPFVGSGFAIASFDQHMTGERKLRNAPWFEQAAGLRERGALTVIEARRLVDYLETRPDVAPDRIYLIGASYGAMTGAIAAAFDPRFRAVALVYGGGDLRKMAGSPEVRKEIGPLAPLVGQFLGWFAAVSDPVNYVGAISPRPIFFQNGDRDRIVVPAAAEALYDAAQEPKEIKWYPSDHLDLDPEYIPIAVNDGVAWFKARDAEYVARKGNS